MGEVMQEVKEISWDIQRRVVPGSIEHEFTDAEWVTVNPKGMYRRKYEASHFSYMWSELKRLRAKVPTNEYRLVETVTIEKVLDF